MKKIVLKYLLIFVGLIFGCEPMEVELEQQLIDNVSITSEEPTTFDFTVIPEKNKDFVKDFTVFHFSIDKKGNEDLTYELVFSGQYGEFNFDGNFYKTGQVIKITEESFSIKYRALEITSNNINITITGSNGLKINKEVQYKSLPTNFDFIIEPGHFHSYAFHNNVYFEIKILPPPLDDYKVNYKMYYDLVLPLNNSGYFEFENENIKEIQHSNTYDFNGETFSRANFGLLGSINPLEGVIIIHLEDENGVKVSKQYDIVWEKFGF